MNIREIVDKTERTENGWRIDLPLSTTRHLHVQNSGQVTLNGDAQPVSPLDQAIAREVMIRLGHNDMVEKMPNPGTQ